MKEEKVAEVSLTLLVIRSPDIEKLKSFYEMIGLAFQQEKHGQGPVHYSCALGETVLELYPLSGAGAPHQIRLGFGVSDLAAITKRLQEAGYAVKWPKSCPKRTLALAIDPDGRTVELRQITDLCQK